MPGARRCGWDSRWWSSRRKSFALGDAAGKTMARILRTPQDMIAFVPLIGARGWIAEEFVPGTGKGVSVLACEGEILFAWQHRRIATATETGASAIRIGEPVDPTLLRDVRLLARDAGFALGGDVRIPGGRNRTPPRADRGQSALSGARWRRRARPGVDFPGMLWELLTGRPVTLAASVPVLPGCATISTGDIAAGSGRLMPQPVGLQKSRR